MDSSREQVAKQSLNKILEIKKSGQLEVIASNIKQLLEE